MSESPAFAEVLAALLAGADLEPGTVQWVMRTIMAGEATSAQIAAFAVALRAKGETADEVGALVSVMLDNAVALPVSGPALDVVGTGGDRAHTVNISTMTALVCAASGARVVKHGNRAASSSTGTADVLEALGIRIDLSAAQVAACVETVGIGFAFAPVFHPAMRHAATTRREIGIPTVFNILGPLANPARPASALIGCADARLAPVIAAAAHASGQRALVVRGSDGLDEISPAAPTQVWDATGDEVVLSDIDPVQWGLQGATLADLRGGQPAENAQILRDVLSGSRQGRLGVIADTVALNAAAALSAYEAAVSGHGHESLRDRLARQHARASATLTSGAAIGLLERWIAAVAAI